jgi:hypothetical protein
VAQLLDFDTFAQFVLTPLAFVLQLLVLFRFRDSQNRDYPLAIVYSLVLPLITASVYVISSPLAKLNPTGLQFFADAYAGADLVMHVLLLALMLQLTGRSVRILKINPIVFYALVLISVAVLAFASWNFLENSNVLFHRKFAAIRRYVSVYSVILNVIWWTFLLRSRKLDRRILLLSAGIGLQMTGQVISDSLYTIGLELKAGGKIWMNFGVLIGMITHLLCLYSWLRAFSPANAPKPGLDSEKQALPAQ